MDDSLLNIMNEEIDLVPVSPERWESSSTVLISRYKLLCEYFVGVS